MMKRSDGKRLLLRIVAMALAALFVFGMFGAYIFAH